MWELDHKVGWALKNRCFWAVALEKTLEIPLDSKEIKPVSPKGNQSWLFIGRTDAEAETPIIWPPDGKSWLIGKDPEVGKIEGGWRRGWQRMRWSDGITDSIYMSLSELREMWRTGKPGVLQSMGSQRVSYWKTTNKKFSPDLNSVRASPHFENLKRKSQKATGAEPGLKPRSVWFYGTNCPLRR